MMFNKERLQEIANDPKGSGLEMDLAGLALQLRQEIEIWKMFESAELQKIKLQIEELKKKLVVGGMPVPGLICVAEAPFTKALQELSALEKTVKEQDRLNGELRTALETALPGMTHVYGSDHVYGADGKLVKFADDCAKCTTQKALAEKRKDEGCENCGRPDRACEEHGKPIGVSKVSGPGFCGECLGVLPCQVHCAHDWSASAGQVCAKCGQFRVRR